MWVEFGLFPVSSFNKRLDNSIRLEKYSFRLSMYSVDGYGVLMQIFVSVGGCRKQTGLSSRIFVGETLN